MFAGRMTSAYTTNSVNDPVYSIQSKKTSFSDPLIDRRLGFDGRRD